MSSLIQSFSQFPSTQHLQYENWLYNITAQRETPLNYFAFIYIGLDIFFCRYKSRGVSVKTKPSAFIYSLYLVINRDEEQHTFYLLNFAVCRPYYTCEITCKHRISLHLNYIDFIYNTHLKRTRKDNFFWDRNLHLHLTTLILKKKRATDMTESDLEGILLRDPTF